MSPLTSDLLGALTARRAVAGLSLVAGTALIVAGMVRLALYDRTPSGGRVSDAPSLARSRRWLEDARVPALLLLVTAAGAWLRIFEIDVKTFMHTEAMLPNLAWPAHSWPPSRFSFYDTFWWHYHSELHPPAHYLLIWAWTHLFGTGLTSLRLPSALFGIGAILVVYRIGAVLYSRNAGLLAAALVAFNGFHIYNSQYARVYMMGTFMALLSTLALLHVMESGRHRRAWEIAYVLVSWLAVYTQTFFWFVLAVQIVWVAIQVDRKEGFVKRILGLQALVVMVGAAAIAHQIYQGAPMNYPPTSLAFVVDYLLLGFAFLPDIKSIPARIVFPPVYWSFAALAILIIGIGSTVSVRASGVLGRRTAGRGEAHESKAVLDDVLPSRAPVTVAVGSALVTAAFVIVALRRNALMTPTVALPFLALAMPFLHGRVRAAFSRRDVPPRWRRLALSLSRSASLIVLLAFLPAAALLAISFDTSVLHPRAFMMFASYLLILAGAGAWVLVSVRPLRVPLLAALAAMQIGTVSHMRYYPSESRDNKAIAAQMNERMRPGDLMFVIPQEHAFTPIYYYLNGRGYTYVASDYAAATARGGADRVWLVFVESADWGPFRTTTDEMMAALSDFRVTDEVTALRARAQLWERRPD